MPRLDGAGVHRTHGDLVHPVALDTDELVAVEGGGDVRRQRGVDERPVALRPGGVPQPGPGVRVRARHAREVAHRTLHARGRREEILESGVRFTQALERQADDETLGPGQGCGAHGVEAVLAARPERDEPPARGAHILHYCAPFPGGDGERSQTRGPGLPLAAS